jgi:hypothetical protein
MCCYRLCVDGSGTDPDGDGRKGFDFAQRVLEVAGDDPEVIVNAALALSYFGEDINAMIALVDHALALNPNFARGWHVGGILRLFAGQPGLAIEHAETALRLSPRARVGTSLSLIGQALFLAQRLMNPFRNCSWQSKRIRVSRRPIVIWRPAMPIWGASPRRAPLSPGYGGLPAG